MLSERKSDRQYLDVINQSPDEKASVREYLAGLNRRDVVLEIGPGGGAAYEKLLETIKDLDPSERPRVITLDASKEPLSIARQKLEFVNTKIADRDGIKGGQIQADAACLPFTDEVFSAVNVSSLVHEVFSYSGGEEGVKNFVGELARVMKLGGVVAYRDPDGTELYKSAATFLRSRMIRIFAAVFFKKYFANGDTKKMNGPGVRYLENFRLSVDGLRIQPADISTRRLGDAESVLLSSYAGLIHELKRHFVVFMTTFFPEVFHEINETDDGWLKCIFSRNSGAKVLRDFCAKNGMEISYGENERVFMLPKTVFQSFEADIKSRFENIYKPTELKCDRPEQTKLVSDFLTENGLQSTLHGSSIIIGFEDLVRVYVELKDFLRHNDITLSIGNDVVLGACDWFEREGRESYFYGDYIDVIATFIESSLRRDRENSAIGYTCFVPISVERCLLVERPSYAAYVSSSVSDVEGGYQDGKRNIHFVKNPLEEAFAVLFAMYQKNNDERLRKVLDNLLRLAQNSLDTEKSSREKRVAENDIFEQITDNIQVICATVPIWGPGKRKTWLSEEQKSKLSR